jgi:hypothetical protein
MVKVGRILIALAILLSGVAMIPFVELPTGQLGWQLYAGVYDATLVSNYDTGRPGSFFTFTGANFPPNSLATITAAGPIARSQEQGSEVLGTVMTDANGGLVFLLNTEGADVGVYLISATVDANATATDTIELIASDPLRPAEGIGPIIYLGNVIYLPVVVNN